MNGKITEAQIRREMTRMDDRAAHRRALIGAIVVLAVAFAIGALAAVRVFTLVDIRGDGMETVLQSGDVALCVRADAPVLAEKAGRGALALVRYSDSGLQRYTVRRVIAMGGDEVSVDETGRVTLNGAPLEEPYAAYRSGDDWIGSEARPGGALENPFAPEGQSVALPPAAETAALMDDVAYPLTVPEGMAFVLCDNRDNVLDSRSSRFGLVSEANLQGLARAVLWPAYRVGRLDGA